MEQTDCAEPRSLVPEEKILAAGALPCVLVATRELVWRAPEHSRLACRPSATSRSPIREAAILLLDAPDFPARGHLIAHCVREIANGLPWYFDGAIQSGVDYPALVGGVTGPLARCRLTHGDQPVPESPYSTNSNAPSFATGSSPASSVPSGRSTVWSSADLAAQCCRLAFREADAGFDGWTVVDFKTDREFGAASRHYLEQVRLYARAVAASTRLPARGIILVV